MTQKSRLLPTAVALICLPLVVSLYVGCEGEPSSDGLDGYFDRNPYVSDPRVSPSALSITPNQAQISSIGQTIRFKVNGGTEPYTWDVSKSDVGTVQRLGNSSEAIYTALQVADNNVIAADREGQAVIGNIARVAGIALAIIPENVSISNQVPGDVIQFTVVGGTPPYGEWTVSLSILGTIDQNGLYRVENPGVVAKGNNTITITDSRGAVDTATVTHQ